ncbi:MAG: hypothetical protein ACD_75C01403G0002 [uncultured bacterium]|nr:MAG: hypothetical protein ACD_75C01403G0002 [uncultured bacterium]
MVFGNDGFFHRIHAAHGRAVAMGTSVDIPRTNALQPGYFLRFLFVGRPHQMPMIGSRRAENPLHLEGSDDVVILPVLVGVEILRIEGGKSGGEDNRPHLQAYGLLLLLEIDGTCRADLGTEAAFAFLEVDAVHCIDAVFQRNCLGILDIDRFSRGKPGIEGIGHLFGALLGTLTTGDTLAHIDVSGVLHQFNFEVSGGTFDGFYFG